MSADLLPQTSDGIAPAESFSLYCPGPDIEGAEAHEALTLVTGPGLWPPYRCPACSDLEPVPDGTPLVEQDEPAAVSDLPPDTDIPAAPTPIPAPRCHWCGSITAGNVTTLRRLNDGRVLGIVHRYVNDCEAME